MWQSVQCQMILKKGKKRSTNRYSQCLSHIYVDSKTPTHALLHRKGQNKRH